MTIDNYYNSKTVTGKELNSLFTLEKELEVDMQSHDGSCLNCGVRKSYLESMKSESWTSTFRCLNCNAIIFITHQDRMGGTYRDGVYIYKEKLK